MIYANLGDLCVLFSPDLSMQALQEKLWNVAAPLYLKQSDLASAAAKQVSILGPSQMDLCPELSKLEPEAFTWFHASAVPSSVPAHDRSQ